MKIWYGMPKARYGRISPILVFSRPRFSIVENSGPSATCTGISEPSAMTPSSAFCHLNLSRDIANAAKAEMRRPSGTLITVMMRLFRPLVQSWPMLAASM